MKAAVRAVRLFLSAALLALAAAVPAPVSAAQPYYDCDDGGELVSIGHLVRTKPAIYGAMGRATIKDIHACYAPGSSLNEGQSLILPANVQNANGTLTAQLGYGIVDCVDITILPCTNYMPDNVRTFIYTPTNNQVYRPVDWYDFNNDGIQDPPILGHDYEFSISFLGPTGEKYWNYCIKDVTDSTATKCKAVDTTLIGTKSWYGAEIKRASDQFGASGIWMSRMAYRLAQQGAWWYLSGDTTCSWAYNHPTWANCGVGFDGWGTVIYPSTTAH